MNYCCAGIVLFNPEIDRLTDNIAAIKEQVNKIILIDNNSNNSDQILKEYELSEEFIIVRNNENKGIATALNQICEIAEKNEYEWVLLLDQDSVCSPNLIESYKKYISDESVALLTPYIIDINKLSFDEYSELKLPETSAVNWAITSGSLIRLKTWEKVGRFYDDLFIDAVDIDYSIRLKLNGYKQIRVNREYLLQEVGHAEPTCIMRPHKDNSGKWTIKRYYRSNHSLLRQYYMTRNNIIIARKYSQYIPMMKSVSFTMVMSLPKPFVEKNKFKLLHSLILGFKDGFKFKVIKYIK
ncbi:glycosyltransferase family 2 protein [Bacillus sp. 22-7]|uniref:glycosyltransferase family 2 protein n=1 Tax=Bacillus sp. 22-7 TaxID=2709707 RepID=UPI001100EB22|nr:glycosyltransferase family 2 protein [Bacillus sp. 22-7]